MTKPQTIFLIDDESTLRDVVRRYLELDGFQVVEAHGGTITATSNPQHGTTLTLTLP